MRSILHTGPEDLQDGPERVRDASIYYCKERHCAVIRILEDHPTLLKSDAEAQYIAGCSWIRLHRPERAKPLLEAAAKGGFAGKPEWETTKELLERVGLIERLCPPPAKDLPEDEQLRILRIFADDTPWNRAVFQALPEYVRRAKEVLGEDLPPIDFYLLRSTRDYTDFFKALFGVDIAVHWQNGTGSSNVVVYCPYDLEGRSRYPAGSALALGDVLHEYGHALTHTLYGDGYLRGVPQWFNEGLSDYLARGYYQEHFERSADMLRRCLAGSPAPSLEDLSRRLYEQDPGLRYALGDHMVDELLRDRDPKVIRQILRRARPDGNFDRAIVEATGIPPSELRNRVIARFR